MDRGALILALAAAAIAPFRARPVPAPISTASFPGWPASFEGRMLTPLDLADREAGFSRGFPGRIGRFTDGRRELVLRWVVEPTRRLHPSADCFRGLGHAIVPADSTLDPQGRRWSAFRAVKGRRTLLVKELIVDANGRTWSDVPSWYWPAAIGRSRGPWLAYTVAEAEP